MSRLPLRLQEAKNSDFSRSMNTEPTTLLPATPPLPTPASDAAWGRAIWDWLREMLTEDLMKLAERHSRARRVKYNPDLHGGICDAEPGDEIWWWGEARSEYEPPSPTVTAPAGQVKSSRKWFECPVCRARFGQWNVFHRHMEQVHSDHMPACCSRQTHKMGRGNWTCISCGRVWKSTP